LPELGTIIEDIRAEFTAKNAVRDLTLNRSRELIRLCSLSIRATHRHDWDEAATLLGQAREHAGIMREDLTTYPDLYHTGYTQDALKELTEGHVLFACVRGEPLPAPGELGVPAAACELRRFVLDLIRRGEVTAAEPYLATMDDIYSQLITMDFPDSLTGGLRRTTDMLRAVLERTTGDLTVAVRQEELEAALRAFEERVKSR
jgi:translin